MKTIQTIRTEITHAEMCPGLLIGSLYPDRDKILFWCEACGNEVGYSSIGNVLKAIGEALKMEEV